MASPTKLILRNADYSSTLTYTGPSGEITVDTTNNIINVHDAVTPGGIQMANAVQSNALFSAIYTKSNTLIRPTTASSCQINCNNFTIQSNLITTGSASIVGYGRGFANSVIFAANVGSDNTGTWTIPAGVANVKCTVIGGGGGGGATSSTAAGSMAQGGASGAVAIGFFTPVAGVTTVSFIAGSGGSKGVAGTSAGVNGGTSSVTYNGVTIVAVTGGTGGSLGATTSTTAGGTVTTAHSFSLAGFVGGLGGTASTTNFPYPAGGNTPLGYGIGGIPTGGGVDGGSAQGYGAGGAGGCNGGVAATRSGGNGSPGAVIFEW